ncbi:SDR family oxidoreductase [Rhizobium sp. AG855]|uniref:SDR family oxidoreductase n=1 Tax=Rhizobium sp. AG855 TaxID=2183898 RepID=UPI000E715527|nr:SDR family oxidoreductase [Rhizobium sp. AG855]RKE85754.1 NADP-dependent 3-hydroxy acid dehydrogenase YdfG [Rhizobium sp. AG855]
MNSILITGASAGFGLATAKLFLDRGWRVIAGMRTPRADLLAPSDRLQVVALDVTDPDSIKAAVEQAGPIDVLVNNAGIGWMNAVEGTGGDTLRALFETNTFGPAAMMQAVLPQMRDRRSGVIVNVSSSVTLKPLPLLSAYTASKAALNALTEVSALELAPFDIRVRIVLPGRAPTTGFGDTARTKVQEQGGFPEAYLPVVKAVMDAWASESEAEVTKADDVAEAVWQAATDPTTPLRIPAGADAVALAG